MQYYCIEIIHSYSFNNAVVWCFPFTIKCFLSFSIVLDRLTIINVVKKSGRKPVVVGRNNKNEEPVNKDIVKQWVLTFNSLSTLTNNLSPEMSCGLVMDWWDSHLYFYGRSLLFLYGYLFISLYDPVWTPFGDLEQFL